MSEEIERLLKEHNLRKTDKRIAILQILNDSQVPQNIEDIYNQAKKVINMNLSTTYRTMTTLCNNGIVTQILNQDGKAYYQINRRKHQHYLICSKCKKIVIIDECPLHELEHKLELETRYQITDHRLEFIGLCPKCQKVK